MGSYLGFTNYIINDRQFAIRICNFNSLEMGDYNRSKFDFSQPKKSTLVQAHQFPIFVCTEKVLKKCGYVNCDRNVILKVIIYFRRP